MFSFIDQHSKTALIKRNGAGNSANFSIFKELDHEISFKNFSIKFVLTGKETYYVNGQAYALAEGDYLLANNHAEGKAFIDSHTDVYGFCIDLSMKLITELCGSYIRPDTLQADLELGRFFNSPSYIESSYHFKDSSLGHILFNTGSRLKSDPNSGHALDHDFYFNLAQCIIEDHKYIIGPYLKIESVKTSTRKELFRKLEIGRKFIDESYKDKLEIPAIAKEAMMSEFHFYRLFKKCYGLSPLQYILNKKTELAEKLMADKSLRLSEVASICGFSDVSHLNRSLRNKIKRHE